MMNKVRWSELSTANIGLETVIPALQKSLYCQVDAIGSRNIEKAKKTAKLLNIEKAYGFYNEFLNDEEIDAIYFPLPNHLNVERAIQS